jgi:hypothetical protein
LNLLKKVIPQRVATLGLLTLFSLVIVFHLLVLVQVIPYKIVWGGRLENDTQMIRFEVVSIALNLTMLTWVAIRSGYLKWEISQRWIQPGMWIMTALFLLNTVGNLFAINDWERWIFTPLTFLLTMFSLRLSIESNIKTK